MAAFSITAEQNLRHMPSPAIAILGGDAREQQLIGVLYKRGYQLRCFARPPESLPAGVRFCETASEAMTGADAVLMPIPGLRAGGKLYCGELLSPRLVDDDFSVLPAQTPVLAGVISQPLREITASADLRLIATAELEEIAAPAAIATAEGAMALAIEADQFYLYGRRALIIGYGHIGSALAPRLSGLGLSVVIVNRNSRRRDEAIAAGWNVAEWQQFDAEAANADLIFNTAPALLLDKKLLATLKPDCLIIDVSAAPGGCDFGAARQLGIKAIPAFGLPGRFAPQTMGKILATVYPQLLDEYLVKKGSGI